MMGDNEDEFEEMHAEGECAGCGEAVKEGEFEAAAAKGERTVPKLIEGEKAPFEPSSPAPQKGQASLGTLEPKRVIEAALFMSSKPLSLEELGRFAGVAAPGFIEGLVKELAKGYSESGSSITIALEPGGYIMRLRAEYAAKVAPLAQESEISRGALKLLAYVSQNEGIEQSMVANTLGSTVYDRVQELVEKGFLDKQKKGRTSVLRTTQKFRDYFGS